MTCLTIGHITSGVAVSQHTVPFKHHSDIPCIVVCREPRVGWPRPDWRSQGQPFRRCGALHTRDCPQRAGQSSPSALHPYRAAQPICTFSLEVWLISGKDPCLLVCLLQGHALFVRQAGGYLPCPQVDFTGGFNAFLGAAYGLGSSTIEEVYGAAFGKPCTHAHRQTPAGWLCTVTQLAACCMRIICALLKVGCVGCNSCMWGLACLHSV